PPNPAPYLQPTTATFEFDASTACNPDEVPVWTDFSWQIDTPSDSYVTFVVSTGVRDSLGAVTDLSNSTALLFTKTSLANKNTCAAAWASGGPNVCTFKEDTENVGPVYASRPFDVLVDNTLEMATLPRNYNYLKIVATLNPSSDHYSAPTIINWDLQVSCQAAR
ncbi:MAG TPA: hypothetical protein VHE30_04745, partial [Polyangiaceae bacterium]|nr:hypothetical protein [Polyangiaceae bacterium]